MPHTNSPVITMKRRLVSTGLSNVYVVKLNDEVVDHAWREQSDSEIFCNHVIITRVGLCSVFLLHDAMVNNCFLTALSFAYRQVYFFLLLTINYN